MVRSLRILASALLALSLPAGLAGCGNTGDLFLPPPVTQTPEKVPENPPQSAAPAADTPGSAGTTGGNTP